MGLRPGEPRAGAGAGPGAGGAAWRPRREASPAPRRCGAGPPARRERGRAWPGLAGGGGERGAGSRPDSAVAAFGGESPQEGAEAALGCVCPPAERPSGPPGSGGGCGGMAVVWPALSLLPRVARAAVKPLGRARGGARSGRAKERGARCVKHKEFLLPSRRTESDNKMASLR